MFALRPRKDAQTVVAPTSTPTPTIEPAAEPSATPTSMPTPSPKPEPAYSANAQYRPTAKEGWLPVFRKAETDEKMIAITVETVSRRKTCAPSCKPRWTTAES